MNLSEPAIKINIDSCRDWDFDLYRISHSSNRYFSIVCIRSNGIERIMIDQPEIGILGFMVSNDHKNRQWLIQNKPEPGNVNYYQYSPTVQATKSNYERVHGGKPTPFLGYFKDEEKLIVNIECSEQGDRFLNKFNQNCKYITDSLSMLETNKSFLWVTSEQLKQKLRISYSVNTDARSVITTGMWSLLTDNINKIFLDSPLDEIVVKCLNNSYHQVDYDNLVKVEDLFKNITKSNNTNYQLISLDQMQYHIISKDGIFDRNNNAVISFFDVNFIEREVNRWQQPLMERCSLEHCVLVFHIINNVAYFYLSVYPELGFLNRVELGPSFQTGDDIFKISETELEQKLEKLEILAQIDQSDEGGRFYRNITRYIFGQWKHSPEEITNENGIWLTAGEIEKLSLIRGKLSNECRTALSLMLSFA